MSTYEKAAAAGEARDAVASRPSGSSTAAVAAAMRRYLSAEQYRELDEADGHAASKGSLPDDPT
ncbi:hypothetical protein ISU10_05310 [Nocardioides agariphilus]|uniref:Uncharacterized protein n=2 Tax=Nocardioides agariphilus TaxID=433664 RepID=A0A930VLZ0_9ACTN|nr:hypothetical protein [Nocardioides agariphilus]